MMAIPKGGISGRKLYFFQVKEIELNKFEAVLKSFIKDINEFHNLIEKIKICCSEGEGEFLDSNPLTRKLLFTVTNQANFIECALREGLIFRK